MPQIYHVLGANIPHHNQTVLRFFAEQLQAQIAPQAMAKFLLVGNSLAEQFPSLNIEEFPSKKAIAQHLVQLAKAEPDVQFFLHGQFNFPLWIAILLGKIKAERLIWHIWGADLYEDSPRLLFKLLYPLRRLAQKRLRFVVGTQGDLAQFAKLNKQAQGELLYFPTKMDLNLSVSARLPNQHPCILLGNSGDPSNRHLQALRQIHQNLGDDLDIIVPMGYPENNQAYIAQVQALADQLFPAKSVQILRDKIPFEQYLQILSACDLGYFIFERQQGIGTICLLTQFKIPLVLHRQNPFTLDMQQQKIPFLFADELSWANMEKTQEKMTALCPQNIAFFAPHYVQGWLQVLTEILNR